MPEGYYPEEPESVDEQLDELLCEYVDGTMDPAVRSVFEEYLDTNPDLAAHARCLTETRDMLCHVGACRCASMGMQAQLRLRLASELARRDRSAVVVSNRLGNFAMLTSAFGLVLILGMMAGLTVVQRTVVDGIEDVVVDDPALSTEMTLPTDAHGTLGRAVQLELFPGQTGSGFWGPVSALPVISRTGSMTPAYWPWDATRNARSRFTVVSATIAP